MTELTSAQLDGYLIKSLDPQKDDFIGLVFSLETDLLKGTVKHTDYDEIKDILDTVTLSTNSYYIIMNVTDITYPGLKH